MSDPKIVEMVTGAITVRPQDPFDSLVSVMVRAERQRQDDKFGSQRHFPSFIEGTLEDRQFEYGAESESVAKAKMEFVADIGQTTWAHIFAEEVAEVYGAVTNADLVAELVQVAAVASAWAAMLVADGVS